MVWILKWGSGGSCDPFGLILFLEKRGNMNKKPVFIIADMAAPRAKPTNYPEPFASMVNGRTKRPLGDLFGIKNFGVNLTTLSPGVASSIHHQHSRQDEMV